MHIQNIFGSGLWMETVDPESYDKEGIINTINKNYEKSPHRNKWGSNNMHHMFDDWLNPKFLTPDFTSLFPIYENIVDTFLTETGFSNYNFRITIVNYTVIREDQEMPYHSHIEGSTFAFVHYISYDPEAHYPLVFHNDSPNTKWLRSNEGLCNKLNENSLFHSMWFEKWAPPIQEDTLILFPAYLEHSVENFFDTTKKSNKNRICLASNVLVE